MPQRFAIEIDDRLAARLKEAAAKHGRTVEAFAAEAVESAIDHLESWAEDEAAYAQYLQTGESIPLEAAEKWSEVGERRTNSLRLNRASRPPSPGARRSHTASAISPTTG